MNPFDAKLNPQFKRRTFLSAAACAPSAVLGVTGIAASAESQQNQSLTHSIPRVSMAHLPTHLEELPRLTKLIGGPRLLVKRDDQTGLALGGNKVRKLEFLVAQANAERADTLVTSVGIQSNLPSPPKSKRDSTFSTSANSWTLEESNTVRAYS